MIDIGPIFALFFSLFSFGHPLIEATGRCPCSASHPEWSVRRVSLHCWLWPCAASVALLWAVKRDRCAASAIPLPSLGPFLSASPLPLRRRCSPCTCIGAAHKQATDASVTSRRQLASTLDTIRMSRQLAVPVFRAIRIRTKRAMRMAHGSLRAACSRFVVCSRSCNAMCTNRSNAPPSLS